MSALYGWLKPDAAGTATRRSFKTIEATVASWHGAVAVELHADGRYRVLIGPHPNEGGPNIEVVSGSVHEPRTCAMSYGQEAHA